MGYENRAGKLTSFAMIIIALVLLADGFITPKTAKAAYEYGWKQSDSAGSAGSQQTTRYQQMTSPNVDNMRVISYGLKSTLAYNTRFCLFIGDAGTNNNAVKVASSERTASVTNAGWQWFDLPTPYDLAKNVAFGVGWKKNNTTSGGYYYVSGTTNFDVQRFFTLNDSAVETTAFVSPITGATEYGYVYSFHVVYVLYPTVSTNPTALDDATGGYTITGSGFEALDEFTSQGQPYNSGRATTSEVWITQNNSWSSPGTKVAQTIDSWNNTSISFTADLTGLTLGMTAYLWVENSDGEHTSTGIPVTLNSPSDPKTYAGTATAVVASNTQIDVTMPFVGDNDNDGTCTVEYNTSDSWPGTSATGSPVSGASPRQLSISSGLSAGSTYYVRVTYNDPDTVVGTATQVLGPYVMQLDTVVGSASATVDSSSQITVTVPFTGDVDGDGSTQVEYSMGSPSWPGTVECASVTGSSPRQCIVGGLSSGQSYYFRITHTDPDGVSGTNPAVIGPYSTPAQPSATPVVTLVTPTNWPMRDGSASFPALRQKVAVVVSNPDSVGLTVSTVTLNNGAGGTITGWGTVNSTAGTYGPVLPGVTNNVITWNGPFNIPAGEAMSFYCEMAINVGSTANPEVDYTMTGTVNSNSTGSPVTTATVPVRWSRRAYATGGYAYMGTESSPVYCINGAGEGLPGGTPYAFSVEFRVPANTNTSQNRYDWHGPSSTTQPTNPSQVIRASIPAGWTNVTAPATQGIWNGVTVSGNSSSGWTITGSISPGQAMGPAIPGSCGDFVTSLGFNATPPSGLSQTQSYVFQVDFGETDHTRLIEDYSTSCTVNSNGTNRTACDLRGGFMVVVEGGDIVPPGEVTSFTPTPSDNRVSMTWSNPGDTDFTGVLILRNTVSITNAPAAGVAYSVDGVGGPNTIGTSRVVYMSNGASFVDGDPCIPAQRLANGLTYYYKAFTYDAKLNYSTGSQVSSTPFDLTPPGDVTGIYVTPGDRTNTIYWTNPSECDFSGVTIRYSTVAFPNFTTGTLAGNKLGGTPGVADSFTHQSLVNGTPYYYTIWTHDDENTVNWSSGASPATYSAPLDNVAPGQITDLAVVSGDETAFTIRVRWTSPADSGFDAASGNASKYYLRFYDQPITDSNWDETWNPGGEWLPQPIAVGSTQSYTVTGLSPLHDYYFAIRAEDEVGNLATTSNSPMGTTLCNAQLTACDQCHQMPPQDGLPGQHPRATGNIGKHTLPIHAGAGEAEVCNVCHTNGNVWRNNTTLYDYNHQDYVIDINDPGMIGNYAERTADPPTGGTFVPYTEIVYKFEGYSTGVGYNQVTGYCVGTYCHGAGLSSPRWGIDNIVCGEYCHETPPATGKHVKHYHPGQHYVNFAPGGTPVSGYDNDDGTTGWSGSVTMGNNGSDPDGTPKGNRDDRYRTFLESSDTQKTFLLPAGNWYITVCVGDSDQVMTGQTVRVSGDGGSTWKSLIDNFNCRPEKHFDKTVDFPFAVTGANNMILQVGNGTDATRINYMIVNSTPEAPKTNNTILQNTASAYGFNCGKCHTADYTQAGHTGHVNGAVVEDFRDAEIHFDANSFPKNPLGNYTAIFDPVSSYLDGQGFRYTLGSQCANLYCHGSTLDAGGSNNTPTWEGGYVDVEGASLCGACHEAGYADSTPFTNMSGGSDSHNKHVSNRYATRVDCFKCHNHTVAPKNSETGEIAISDKTHHVNGEVDAVFDPNDNTMRFGRYSTSIKTCYDVYCHSNGLLKNNQPFWATVYREPVWGSGTKKCNYCHGNGHPQGEPIYESLSTTPNSHGQHALSNGIGCSMCHYETTRDNGVSIYTSHQPSLHVNGTRNVTFNKAIVGATAQFNSSNLECTNTYCHGLSAPPKWGSTTVNCGSCHGNGLGNPNPGIGNHFVHNNGGYDLNSSVVTNYSDTANYDFSCRFCHFRRTHGGGPVDPGMQTAEVNFNTITAINGYCNSNGVYIPGSHTEIDPVSGWPFTDGKCQNLECHSDGRGGPPNNNFFTWSSTYLGSTPGYNCDGCHSGTADDANKMSSGSHPTHVWESVYRRNCHDCHYGTVFNTLITDKSMHVNAEVNTIMSPAFGGAYARITHECSNVFCHSNGDPTMWNGADVSDFHVLINWTSSQGTTCTTCHSDNYNPSGDGVRTAPQTLSKSHGGHLSNYGSRITCTNCHNATAQNSTTLQPTIPSVHNNGKKNVVFYTSFFNHTGLTADLGGYWGAWQDSPVDGFCTVICHSDGKDIAGGNAGKPKRFPNWSSVNYGCGSCHGAKGNFTTGNHNSHVTLNNFGCGKCHAGTSDSMTADSPTINAAGYSTNHVDGETDVVLSTGTWNSGPKTCSSTGSGCHGTADTPLWGTTGGCLACHDGGSTEVEDYNYDVAPQAMINTDEYTASGHGRTSAYPYTGNPGANLACEACHGAKHGLSHNPFRLLSSATINPSDVNTLCTSCHSTSQTNHHNEANVVAGQDGANATWTFTPKCVDCHDPHGDSGGITTANSNAAMMHSNVNTSGSDNYGVPSGSGTAVDFPDDWTGSFTWGSFVNSSYGGLCQVCHDASDNVDNFNKTTHNTSHNSGGVCTSCHGHDKGFAGAGCNACHGNPPNITDNKADNAGAVGAHDLHVSTLNVGCTECHGHNGSAGGQHNESAVAGGYSSIIPPTNVDVDLSAAPDYHGATQTYNGTPGGWTTNKTCSNVGCHYGTSKDWDCQ